MRLACRDYDGFPGRPSSGPGGGPGPEGGDSGGEVVAIGTPEENRPALGLTRLRGPKPYGDALLAIASAGEGPRVAANPARYTGHYLTEVPQRRGGGRANSGKRTAETPAAE